MAERLWQRPHLVLWCGLWGKKRSSPDSIVAISGFQISGHFDLIADLGSTLYFAD